MIKFGGYLTGRYILQQNNYSCIDNPSFCYAIKNKGWKTFFFLIITQSYEQRLFKNKMQKIMCTRIRLGFVRGLWRINIWLSSVLFNIKQLGGFNCCN